MMRKTAMNAYVGEVISYGSMPLRRIDAYAVCLADTGDRRAADLFAFGPNRKIVACAAMTVNEYRAEIARVDTSINNGVIK